MTTSSTARFPLGPALTWTVGGAVGSGAIVLLDGLIPPDSLANTAGAASLGLYALPVVVLLVLIAWRFPGTATGITIALVVIGLLSVFVMFWTPIPAISAAAGAGIALAGPRTPVNRACALVGILVLAFFVALYAWTTVTALA